MNVRYAAHDWGDTYQICTDDISTFTDEKGNVLLPDYEDIAKKAVQSVSTYQSLFEFIKACINIPVFTHYKDDLFRTERHPTKLKDLQASTQALKALKRVPDSEKIFLREVLFLTSEGSHENSRKTIDSPNIKIETSRLNHTPEGQTHLHRRSERIIMKSIICLMVVIWSQSF